MGSDKPRSPRGADRSSRIAGPALAAVLWWSAVAWGGEAVAPKLGAVSPPPAAVESEATARPLPRTLAICIDRTRQTCWGGERAADCDLGGGQVFATIPVGGGDPGALLRSCWDQVR
jgi:hypothetical protein